MPADESTSSEEEESYEESSDDEVDDEEEQVNAVDLDEEARLAQELQKRLDLSQLISKFETIFPGDGKNFPDPGDLCTVHYTARVVGSTDILESSRQRGRPFTFKLGAMQVVQGWEECFPKMSEGQHVLITCPPAMCYGEAGYPPNIPPSAYMEFDIEFIRRVPDHTRSAFEMRVYLDDDGLRDDEDPDEALEKNLLREEDGDDADSDEYSDNSQGSGADSDAGGGPRGDDDNSNDDEDDVDSDSYDGDADGQEYAKYVFHAK